MNPRKAAVLSLNSAFKQNRFVNLEADSAIKKYAFADKDKAFYTRLLYGTVEKKITLDYILQRLSERPLENIDALIRCVLETGLYQLFYMDRVPDYSVCNEMAEVAKTTCAKSAVSFINAILRTAIRQKEAILSEIAGLQGIAGLSVQKSIPAWILSLWQTDYGDAAAIAEGFECMPPYLSLHVNTRKISPKDLMSHFDKDTEPRIKYGSIITLNKSRGVEELYGFHEGLFFVQDTSSALAASVISPQRIGDRDPLIIDTCACPGGKTFAMAMDNPRARILSMDLHENRLSLIKSGAERLGLDNITTLANDGRRALPQYAEMADAVLCDVPCSGLGIIGKKPDIRFKSEEDIRRIADVQYAILSDSASYVKKGGALVYSTCTLRKAENEDNVMKFLAAHEEFCLDELPFGACCGMKTFFPHIDKTDGFFTAVMKRKP